MNSDFHDKNDMLDRVGEIESELSELRPHVGSLAFAIVRPSELCEQQTAVVSGLSKWLQYMTLWLSHSSNQPRVNASALCRSLGATWTDFCERFKNKLKNKPGVVIHEIEGDVYVDDRTAFHILLTYDHKFEEMEQLHS